MSAMLACWHQQRDNGAVANQSQSLDRTTYQRTQCKSTLSSPVKMLRVPRLKHTGVRALCLMAFWQTISWDGCSWCQHDMAPQHTSNSSVMFHIVIKQWHYFFFPTQIHQHEGTCIKLSQERMADCYQQTGQPGKTRWRRLGIMPEKL